MSLGPLPAAIAVLLGNFLLSLGMVLQKKNVSWIGKKTRPRGRPQQPSNEDSGAAGMQSAGREKLGWFVGFMLMNLMPLFNYVGLLGLPPNVVGSMAGSNVAFTALLSAPLLGERLGGRALAWSGLLFLAICFAGLRGGSGESAGAFFSAPALYLALAIPLAAGLLSLILRRKKRGAGLALGLAAVAGALAGYMVLPMRVLQLKAGPPGLGWLSSPFLYLFLAGGVSSFLLTQFAYKDGAMSSVAPAFYGSQVLWAALASYLVFAAPFDLPQAAAFVCIALCVAMIAGSGSKAKTPLSKPAS